MSDTVHRVVTIPGDGIGREVVPAAQRVLDRAGTLHGSRSSGTSSRGAPSTTGRPAR